MGTSFEALSKLPADNPQLVKALSSASEYSFRYVALLPAVLVIVFGIIWLRDKAAGGYKIEKIGTKDSGKPEKVKV